VHAVAGADTTLVALLAAAGICLVVLVVILVGPSRSVREEPPLDPTAENRILLGRDPELPTGELPRISVAEDPPDDDASLAALQDLDDGPDGGRAG
jgi:hypothetical protein